MEIRSVDNGALLDLVCFVKIFDSEQTSHLMVCMDGTSFLFEGFISDEFHSFTIFNAVLKQQYPVPMITTAKDTHILGHRKPSWDALMSVVDLCAGFGGLAQGATASGFSVQVAVDQNPKMIELYTKASEAHVICGDIGSHDVVREIWRHSSGAATVTSGFSCQPFSKLGDGKSQDDTRANCLTKTLETAFYLQAQLIILECVAPAAQDSFVKGEIDHFTKSTGFFCTQTELRLDHIWPCRCHRSWWVLSAPYIGPVELKPWPPLASIQEVQQVIPEIRLWAHDDEMQLSLDDVEIQAFGVADECHSKYLLNGKSKAPCALHAWGSQTRACPCGCRKYGFTQSRLENKGLHGCLVRSASFPDGTSVIRHVHPNEAMGLNTFDPVIDFGTDVRLTLSAVGQLACPAQALWILGSVLEKIDAMKQVQTFSASSQIQAYRAWLLTRCRQVWPVVQETIHDPKLLDLMAFWKDLRHLSMAELMFPMRWDGKFACTPSVAAVLDHLIREKESIIPTMPDNEPKTDDEVIPVFDSPQLVDDPDLQGCMYADSCTVVFQGLTEPPIRFQPKSGSTVADFLAAHAKLVGPCEVNQVSLKGQAIGLDHCMEVGQLIIISATACESNNHTMDKSECGISPTAAWTQPAVEIDVKSPPRKVSKFDVGECLTPSMVMPDDQMWLDASALQGLQGKQFLKLQMPCVQNAQQLWSLRHQYVRTHDRIAILECQEHLWADDEIRFHMHAVITSFQEKQAKSGHPVPQICCIDPLVFSAWIHDKGFDCRLWANDHPEVLTKGIPIVTVAMVDSHWIPIFMSPLKDVLHVHTWDGMGASHDGLEQVVSTLALALGFQNAMIRREHRLFFTTELCGALAIAFLRYTLLGTQLPTDCTDATVIHSRLKEGYLQELSRCQIARRPWVWGAGDQPASSSAQTHSDLQLAVNITRDQRIDLINQKWGMTRSDFIFSSLLRTSLTGTSLRMKESSRQWNR